MREILFRGKRVDNGEWVYGYYVLRKRPYFKDKGVNVEHLIYGNVEIEDNDCKQFVDTMPISYVVDPKTISQYTGLTDMNGNKIFEGDILKGVDYPYCSDGVYNYFTEIVWFDNCPAFGLYTFKNPNSKVRGISTGNTDFIEDFDSSKWEVIGNIYDNPELMEEIEEDDE